jgi:hypothetical protein
MKKDSFLYFSDTETGAVDLAPSCIPMPNAEYAAKFAGIKAMRFDSFSMKVAPALNGSWKELYPVTRVIRYKAQPSKHVCNAKCMGGKPNGTCECSCGGKNHARAAFTIAST